MKLNYLLFNILILILPILSFIFYPNIIYPLDNRSIIAILIPSLIFIYFDNKQTNHWWNFNKKFILNIKIFKLPIEEILFFFTVSFSSLTIWINLKTISKLNINNLFFGLFFLIIFLIYHYLYIKIKKPYLKFINYFYFFILISDILILKTLLIFKFKFLIFILIFITLTFIFNLYLTKKPIVIYNNKIKSKLKIFTIPIEDFLYGINFIYLAILIFEFLSKLSIFSK